MLSWFVNYLENIKVLSCNLMSVNLFLRVLRLLNIYY